MMRGKEGPNSVIKRKYTLNYRNALGIGRNTAWLGLACLGLACGAEDEGAELGPRPEEPRLPDRLDCDDNPYLADCPPLPDPEEIDDDVRPAPPPVDPKDLPRAQAQNVLPPIAGLATVRSSTSKPPRRA